MANPPTVATERERLLDEVLTAYLKAVDAGQTPDRQELLSRHPDFAAELTEFFAEQDRLDRLAEPLRAAVGTDTPAPEITLPACDGLATLPAGQSVGDYELLAELGRGGMGVVYKARQKSLKRLVALKMIRPDALASDADLRRFRNEAETVAGLDHPNIVPVYEVVEWRAEGVDAPVLHFSMKLMEGGSLAERLPAFVADPRAAARLVAEVARAVHHAHQRGVLHRDLKPGNILLDGQGQPHVTDFGLAKRIEGDSSLTQSGALVGTPGYMAPEQTTGRRGAVTTATDIYGLGAVLYALLTGRPPFHGETVLETLEQVRQADPEPPRRTNPRIDRDLETVCLKCLEKETSKRYGSAEALAEALQRWLAGEPISARRVTAGQRLARWARRHPRLVTALVLTAMLALAGAWTWDRQRALAEGLAREANDRAASLQAQGRYLEALEAARRAGDLLPRFGDAALGRQVKERAADLRLLNRLEEAQLAEAASGDSGFDRAAAGPMYADAFREYGVDVLAGDEADVLEALRGRAIRAELVAALFHWGAFSPILAEADHLWHLAEALDPDQRGVIAQLRKAYRAKDSDALRQLAPGAEGGQLKPIEAGVLADGFASVADPKEAVRLLTVVQRQHPGDFWVNTNLGRALIRAGRAAEALPYFMAALAVHPDSWGAQMNLCAPLEKAGRHADAEAACRRALRLRPDLAAAHYSLGNALSAQGQPGEAEAEFREALRLRPDYPDAHYNLGNALRKAGRHPESEAEYRRAIQLKQDYVEAHYNLGVALASQGRYAEAAASFRRTIDLKRDEVDAYVNLGAVLGETGQPAEAEAAFRQALRLKPDLAEAHCNLAEALQQQGRYQEALASIRRGHELGNRKPGWKLPSAQLLREAERLAALDARLPAVVAGLASPASPKEQLEFARICHSKKLYTTATRFFAGAFTAEPGLANAPGAHRYDAACAAALAGCGQGKDAKTLDNAERARLRRRALEGLRADLTAYRRLLEKEPEKARPVVRQQMEHWQQDKDFAGVRGPEVLAKLPEAERPDWQKLWQEVEALGQQAQESAKKTNAGPAPTN